MNFLEVTFHYKIKLQEMGPISTTLLFQLYGVVSSMFFFNFKLKHWLTQMAKVLKQEFYILLVDDHVN